ncbi:hypothetical protein GLOIN_2v1771413 [Rhizophagus irregularis DAOM 181602=DAOM 197198]|uniref:BTB domain-containing protein n=1 Tax=Rhizophagus irregularis (strain DAOM 181602 / DAOM 197198 / MUCL 43194) TaxID=747089 RepID=A0A2P4Q9T2_RHIID|nr:hypothetical protein GLOIN_2v1771413 [Rhizophagus irregularis DAOM 181602=DAOM 197198]POG74409.1 hypothetical protein GLOIN_2v1771413 [Rhizophagus irregularis DAOM 181602=DAOM 197198]|eukprot:XP_025181275.1 hypothetical protein GLOIN_2v1771413 [Rhizophagus irregularis DAOM 181602=DAOM 197198]
MTVFRKISLMLSDADDYNVNIQVGENENIKEFHAHSNVLRARSPYFKKIVAWDYLIKWGIDQTPDLGINNNNKINWNNNNYESLKKTLNQFIPLIRFSEIDSADFYDQVRPYKQIIPQYIYENFI